MSNDEKHIIELLKQGKFGTEFFQKKGVADCDCELSGYFYLFPDSVFLKEVTKMADMNLPLFDAIRTACKTMDSAVMETLGSLAFTLFHISQSTEGCKEEGKIVSGRDTEDMEAQCGEYLASFTLYSGRAMSQEEINSWINASFNSTSATEELAEEVLMSGPNRAFDRIDQAL